MSTRKLFSPVILSSITTVVIFFVIVIASCKKQESNSNNPVDLDNCPNYTSSTVSDVVSYFTGCGKTWESVNTDYEPYKSNSFTYKFKSASNLLIYDMLRLPHNTYSDMAFSVFEKNGDVLIKFSPFAAKDTSYFVHDTFRVNIIGKDKVELVNISWKNPDGTFQTGRLGVYKGVLQPDFDNPPANTGTGGSGSSGGFSCPTNYADPTNDGQLNSWCESAYVYRCVNKASTSSTELKYVCNAYKQLKYAGAADCPYCEGVN